jgi:hypothetical protein
MRTVSPLFADACREAAALSFAVGVEHLVLAVAKTGALTGVEAEDVRTWIREGQRAALATLGIPFDDVHARLDPATGCVPITPETKRILELATERRTRELTPENLLATLEEQSANARRVLAALR